MPPAHTLKQLVMEGLKLEEEGPVPGRESEKENAFLQRHLFRFPEQELQTNLFDDDAPKWINYALHIYGNLNGQEELRRKMKEQFCDCNKVDNSIFKKLKLGVKKLQLGLQYNSDSILQKELPCHPRGVGGSGFIHVVSNPKFPEHEFFRAGRVFRIRMRHSNASFEDDAMLDGRVACIKFEDSDSEGPLDLILTTGRIGLFHNGETYCELRKTFAAGEESVKKWCNSLPVRYYSFVEFLRRNPKSYYDQTYYSHIVYEFIGKDGVKRLAKIRLLPADGSEESGLLTKKDQKCIWKQQRNLEDEVSTNYLRHEWKSRLNINPLQYRLQIQLYEFVKDFYNMSNPCSDWDPNVCPWLDLAVVTLSFTLPDDLITKTRYDLYNHPKDFMLPEAVSSQDFNSTAEITHDLFGSVAANGDLVQEENPATEVEQMEAKKVTKYIVSVKTGSTKHAGTDADIFITISGSKGRTRPLELDNRFHDDFEAGQMDMFEVEGIPVGDILTVQMDLKAGFIHNEWYLDSVTVTDVTSEQTVRCPCYRWLTPGEPTVVLRRAEALLPQEEKIAYCYLQRKHELEEMRQRYQWEKVNGLPGRIKAENINDVPREARFKDEKLHDLTAKYWKVLANTGVGSLKTLFSPWNVLKDYSSIITGVIKNREVVKSVAKKWGDDIEFGRQFLNGPNPVRLTRVTQLPVNLMITGAELAKFLDEGKTLQGEIKNGRVYMLSYPEFRDLKDKLRDNSKENIFVPSPLCIFYVNKRGNLMPIAIQLSPVPHHSTPVWTPDDDHWEWMFAKMWVKLADAHAHHLCSRQLSCHLILEAISVATMRNLPLMHPLYKLLLPHIRYTIAVNVNTRFSTLKAEGIFEKYLSAGCHHELFARAAYRRFKVSDLHIPENLRKRGVDESDLLPNYYYRDDALVLWRVINKFIRTTLMLHYHSNSDVQNDEEIQNWASDLHMNGLPQWDGDEDHEVLSSFSTLENLISFVTSILFTASCQHAALTTGMMDYYSFCPNYPTKLMTFPPTLKKTMTEQSILEALPNRQQTANIIAACYTLAKRSSEELFLGEYPDEHFCNDEMLATIDAFQVELKYISERIKERNEGLEWPYKYLLPERIPNSVAI